MQIELSVIIPVYNAQQTLNRCVNSIVQAQQYAGLPMEILLINDGSTDNSPFICNSFEAKNPIIHVINTENHGVSHARNFGIKHSNGNWITFVDADDYIDIHSFSIISEYIYDKNTDLLGWQYDKFNKIVKTKHKPHAVWAYAFRSEVIHRHNIRFAENLKFTEDQLFISQFRLCCSKEIATNKILYHYCENPKQATSQPITLSRAESCLIAACFLAKFYETLPCDDSKKIFVAKTCNKWFKDYIKYASMTNGISYNRIRTIANSHYAKLNHIAPYTAHHIKLMNYPCYFRVYFWLFHFKNKP